MDTRKFLAKTIADQIERDLDSVDFTKENFAQLERLCENEKFCNSLVKVVITKNGVRTENVARGDVRKQVIVDHIKEVSKCYPLPETVMYIYASDTHLYELPRLPVFILAKPENQSGILFPDNTFATWDADVARISGYAASLTSKKPYLYFHGANTGATKHGLRGFLAKQAPPFKVELTKPIPMEMFADYKYLLNLPGHQPWSSRLKYLFLTGSLVVNVNLRQHYGANDVNERWNAFFDGAFVPGKDYIDLTYDWHDGNNTPDASIVPQLENVYNYFEKVPLADRDFARIVKNGNDKARSITQGVVYASIAHLIESYASRCSHLFR